MGIPTPLLLVVLRFTRRLNQALMAHTDAVVKLALREGTQHQKAMEKVLLETTMVQEKTPKLEIAKVKVTTET